MSTTIFPVMGAKRLGTGALEIVSLRIVFHTCGNRSGCCEVCQTNRAAKQAQRSQEQL